MPQSELLNEIEVFGPQGPFRGPLIPIVHISLRQKLEPTRRCTTVRDSEGQANQCNGGSDGSVWVMGKWSMQWVSG